MLELCFRLSKRETMPLASSVICLSMSLRCSLYSLMCLAIRKAVAKSLSTNRSTLSLPFSILPEALMRGPILKTMSLMEISRPLSPQMSMIDFRPMLGLEFSNFRPWKAKMRFSSTTGTMSAAILTAQKSSRGMSREKGIPLSLAKACINLNPTPHPQRCLNGNGSSGRFGLSMATAGGITSSGTW